MAGSEREMEAAAGEAEPSELEQLRAENAALRKQLADDEEPGADKSGMRRVISWILVFLAVVAVVVGVHAAWLKTSIIDEDRFVATFAPLPENAAVSTALSERLADDLIEAGEVEAVVQETLPPDLSFIAVPVTEGLRTITTEVAGEVVSSDVFAGIWRTALRVSHTAASLVLSSGGEVSIDLNELADEVLAALEERGVTLVSDLEIELPTVVLVENDQVGAVADVLDVIETLGWAVPVIALILIAAAIWVSPYRRRTTEAIGFATAGSVLVMLVVVRLAETGTVSGIEDDVTRAAAEAVWDVTLRFYRQSMWAVLVLALLVGLAAWVVGPSPRAEKTRALWDRLIKRWQSEEPSTGFAGRIAEWKRPIETLTVGLGLLVILLAPAPSGLLVLVVALLVVVVVAVVEVVSGPRAPAAVSGADGAEDPAEGAGIAQED